MKNLRLILFLSAALALAGAARPGHTSGPGREFGGCKRPTKDADKSPGDSSPAKPSNGKPPVDNSSAVEPFVVKPSADNSHAGNSSADNSSAADSSSGSRVRGSRVEGQLLVKRADKFSSARVLAAHRRLGARVLKEFGALGWEQVELPRGVSVDDALRAYRATRGVAEAQPNFVYRLDAQPDDPLYAQQYGPPLVSAPAAWMVTTGSHAVVVAVVDTGLRYTHEDLAPNVWTNPGETPANGLDDDANGYVDDVHGADTRNGDGDPFDDHGHGTHVAGIIGAAGNNGTGVAGINWSVRLMAVKMFDAAGVATTATAVAALDYVRRMRERGTNVRVANYSWGGPPEAGDNVDPAVDPALRDAFRAAGDAGVLNVCAAGNNGRDTDAAPQYPASFQIPNLLAVGASAQNDSRAGFSNFGAASVDLAAPGVGILSTVIKPEIAPDLFYGFKSGTSMAAPHAAGAAALLAAHDPTLSAASLKASLMNTTDAVADWSGKSVTGGRLNVARAIQNPTACAYELTPSAQTFPLVGGSGNVGLRTSANCDWDAQSDAAWITIKSATKLSDGGIVVFSVAPHDGPARTGTITIAGLAFTVTQTQTCEYSIGPDSAAEFPHGGGQGRLTMQTGPGCAWQASSLAPWIEITQGSGTGPGAITFNVAPNHGPARVGRILHTDDSFYAVAQGAAPPGRVLISEFRIDGPNGPADEFYEIYNNSDEPAFVTTADGSQGWSLEAWLGPAGGGAPTRRHVCTIPSGTTIPARGHFLCTNGLTDGGGAERGYSLADYGGPGAAAGDQATTGQGVSADGASARFLGLALFKTADPLNFTLANRLDAVGSSTNQLELVAEGPGLDYAGEFAAPAQYSWLRRFASGRPQDTNSNRQDFVLVSTTGAPLGGAQVVLGAPGPENLSSPVGREGGLVAALLDLKCSGASKIGAGCRGRARDAGADAPAAANGTVALRRRFTNLTAQTVTRLRLRATDISTFGSAQSWQADLRLLDSADIIAHGADGQPVALRGARLEAPPAQSLGGGLNSSLVVELPGGLAPGESVTVQLVVGVAREGKYRLALAVEAK